MIVLLGKIVITINNILKIINRLRIGHTRLTDVFLIKWEDPPPCPTCNNPLMIKHILTECRKNEPQRLMYNLSNHLSENLNSSINYVLKFLRETELHTKMYKLLNMLYKSIMYLFIMNFFKNINILFFLYYFSCKLWDTKYNNPFSNILTMWNCM